MSDGLSDFFIFNGIDEKEIPALLERVHARRVCYKAGEFIIEEGSRVNEFGTVLAGRGRSIIWDAGGRVVTLTLLEPGSDIGVMVAASAAHVPVSVQATTDAEVLFIPFEGVFLHEKLLRNYISAVSAKGIELQKRIALLLKPTVREKVMAYLKSISEAANANTFDIPLNRNEMAEYLNVERSALSRELSRMKRDGLIDYYGSSFKLLSM